MNIKIIEKHDVLHPVSFNSGARVTSWQIIEIDGARFRNDFWHNAAGRLVRVDSNPAN